MRGAEESFRSGRVGWELNVGWRFAFTTREPKPYNTAAIPYVAIIRLLSQTGLGSAERT